MTDPALPLGGATARVTARCRAPLDDWLVQHGYTRHIGCLPVPRPEVAPVEPAPVPVAQEQTALDLGGTW